MLARLADAMLGRLKQSGQICPNVQAAPKHGVSREHTHSSGAQILSSFQGPYRNSWCLKFIQIGRVFDKSSSQLLYG